MDQPPESPRNSRDGSPDSTNRKRDKKKPSTPPLFGGPSLRSPFNDKNTEDQQSSQHKLLGLRRDSISPSDCPKTPDSNMHRSKYPADSPLWSSPASPRGTDFGRASPTDPVDTPETNTELDVNSPIRALPSKILFTDATTQGPSQLGDFNLNTGLDNSNSGPNGDPTLTLPPAERSGLRNRRWQK